MSKKLEPGFYWASRKDGGELTVVEVWPNGQTLHLMGNLGLPDIEEAEEYFEILNRIEPPASHA